MIDIRTDDLVLCCMILPVVAAVLSVMFVDARARVSPRYPDSLPKDSLATDNMPKDNWPNGQFA